MQKNPQTSIIHKPVCAAGLRRNV